MSLILALLMQVGPDPLGGQMPGDDLVQGRPPREAAAGADATSAWLESCFAQVQEDPSRAHTLAQIRRSETTGADRVLANLCLGTAAATLGLWEDARAAFAAARAETPEDEPRARARFAALAGNAALAGENMAAARDMLTLAASDARAAGAVLLQAIALTDLSRALVTLGRNEEALAALEEATALAPERGEGWLFKATLLRRLDRLAEAQTAIERAAATASGFPQVGLEAGVIAVLSGRDEAARQSWQSVIALAPDSPAAQTAKDYLAQLGPAGETAAGPTPQEQP